MAESARMQLSSRLASVTVARWAAVGLGLSSPLLTWWALGPPEQQWNDYDYGPYHVPVLLEQVVGWVALAIAVVAVLYTGWQTRRTSHPSGLSAPATAFVVAAGIVGAACWRGATESFDGASIGGGLLPFVAAAGIIALSLKALGYERRRRGGTVPHELRWTAIIWLVGGLCVAVPFVL